MKVDTNRHLGSLLESWTRGRFYFLSFASVAFVACLGLINPYALLLYILVLPPVTLGLKDALQTRHTILRNFPLLGRLRYFFESIRPEVRQYFVESDSEEVPFSREKRSLVFQRAKGQVDTLPFGTRRDVYETGHTWVNHSLDPVHPKKGADRITIGGSACTQKYSSSVLNVAAMSYGALSRNAIAALNGGANRGDFAHNTGEGAISPFHLEPGGDLIWQIGTGYFGCRSDEGSFSPEKFKERSSLESVKMIEIKLSQGAKPAHGGILPGSKVTPEIAEIRGVPVGKDVISPPSHSAFEGPEGLLHFVQQLRELSGGKPVGFKLCIGRVDEWFSIVKAMHSTQITPDFITLDGSEGGTGAAPLEFSNSVGTPLEDALHLVHTSLVGVNLREEVRLIASGRITTGFHILQKIALGADACYSARAMMFALGCIQALKCNTNHCPAGVATQDPKLMHGLVVESKVERVHRFQESTVDSYLDLLGATGANSGAQLRRDSLMRRVERDLVRSFADLYPPPVAGAFLAGDVPEAWKEAWEAAETSCFGRCPL
jgi:glutamate synthase domain-containing protein 2